MIFLIAGLSLQSFAKVNAGANVIDKPQNELTKINSCEFLNKSDDLLKRVISQIKSGNKANEIFCDSDGTKMVYYLLQNGNYDLNIGIAIKVDNNTTNSEFKETFYKKLDEYYSSENWFLDVEDFNNGVLPQDLKCGVLSEDGAYNLFGENHELAIRMVEIAAKMLRR